MARPVYVLCCDSIVEDKTKNLVSVFGITERLTIEQFVSAAVPKKKKPKRTKKDQSPKIGPASIGRREALSAIAVWMKDEGDAGKEFEHRWVLHFPDGNSLGVGGTHTVEFVEDKELQRFKLGVGIGGLPQNDVDGVFRVESLLRKKGNKRWQSQEFPFRFIVRLHEVSK